MNVKNFMNCSTMDELCEKFVASRTYDPEENLQELNDAFEASNKIINNGASKEEIDNFIQKTKERYKRYKAMVKFRDECMTETLITWLNPPANFDNDALVKLSNKFDSDIISLISN
jgi:hypothetical protein